MDGLDVGDEGSFVLSGDRLATSLTGEFLLVSSLYVSLSLSLILLV